MPKLLSQYAKEKNITYHQAWRNFQKNQIPNAYKDPSGRIFIDNAPLQLAPVEQKSGIVQFAVPVEASLEPRSLALAATRLNKTAISEPFNRFNNIEQGFVPYSYNGTSSGTNITINDVVRLCQKAYFNFSAVRKVIDMMTEFSTSKIYLTGDNKTANDFFQALFDKINLMDFQDRFFREYYRSGNVFVYPYLVKLKDSDVREWVKQFRLSPNTASKSMEIPVRYVIINPSDVQVTNSASFINPVYSKILNPYEIQALKAQHTEEDKLIFKNLPDTVKKQIMQGANSVMMPLDTNKFYAVFYKKQDYEPLAVPMIFPVLDDLEWKSELKRIDHTISRTVQQAILVINTGYESKNGEYMVSQANINAIQAMFTNESVGRVLVNDFSTKAEFVIPQIGDILDPKKYAIVNQDIRDGLNDILTGGDSGEKFANQSIKVKMFIARLQQARETFINNFLTPEIKRISKLVGFQSYPTPKFESIDLEDSVEWVRAITRLAEIGFLTPDETISSIQSGRLPTSKESAEAQETFKSLKDKGLYEPITGGPFTQNQLADKNAEVKIQQTKMKGVTGRPPGTKRKQSTKKISPIGAELYSASKLAENLSIANQLTDKLILGIKKSFKLKDLTPEQNLLVAELRDTILVNEPPNKWLSCAATYIKSPKEKLPDKEEIVDELAQEHSLDVFMAAVLLNSVKPDAS